MAAEQDGASELRAGWAASLDLEFACRGGRTSLVRRAHVGPLVVQRPFYPEGEVCHVYLVHPPGGVVGGDQLALRAQLGPGSHALVTTPAATKFYRSEWRTGRQTQHFNVDAATLEWLPQETILFPQARAHLATRVDLSERSRFIGWEVVCYGRPASGLTFGAGVASQDFELWLNGTPLMLDHLRLNGASETMQARHGLAGFPVMGTLFAYPADAAVLEAARQAIAMQTGTSAATEIATSGVTSAAPELGTSSASSTALGSGTSAATAAPPIGTASTTAAIPVTPTIAACTNVDGVLVCRAVATQADAVRRIFTAIWRATRPLIASRPAVLPRIWST